MPCRRRRKFFSRAADNRRRLWWNRDTEIFGRRKNQSAQTRLRARPDRFFSRRSTAAGFSKCFAALRDLSAHLECARQSEIFFRRGTTRKFFERFRKNWTTLESIRPFD